MGTVLSLFLKPPKEGRVAEIVFAVECRAREDLLKMKRRI